MRSPNHDPPRTVEPRCRVCNDTGRASVKQIDEVSMVAWCRCPAGARALDLELAQRRGGARPAAGTELAPGPIPLRRSIHVVAREPHEPDASATTERVQLAEAHLIAVGYRADECAGVVHFLTLRLRGEKLDLPCDRETADAFAASLSAGRPLRYRLVLEPAPD